MTMHSPRIGELASAIEPFDRLQSAFIVGARRCFHEPNRFLALFGGPRHRPQVEVGFGLGDAEIDHFRDHLAVRPRHEDGQGLEVAVRYDLVTGPAQALPGGDSAIDRGGAPV